MTTRPGFEPSDASGLCYPSLNGATTVDALFVASAAARADRIRDRIILAIADSSPATRAVLTPVADVIGALGLLARSRVFATPVAALDAWQRTPFDEEHDPRSNGAVAMAAGRHLVHHPDVPDLGIVFGADAFANGPVYLPHLHALLESGGCAPVAVLADPKCTRIVWADGCSVTLPRSMPRVPDHGDGARLRTQPEMAGIPVLNCAPEVMGLLECLEPMEPIEAAGALTAVQAGVDLLAEVWPEAHAGLRRHLGGVVLLRSRAYARSHSPRPLAAGIALTPGQPAFTADLLCHELAHVRMHMLEEVDPLAETEAGAGFRSPWRDDIRPLRGLVLGVHAFLNVCGWWSRLARARPELASYALEIHGRQAGNVKAAWADVAAHAQPTPLGRLVLNEFEAEVMSL